MYAIIKEILTKLVKSWGLRQVIKLGAVVVPAIGVTQADWDVVASVAIAAVVAGIEAVFSYLNAKRLKQEEPLPEDVPIKKAIILGD